MEKRVRWTGKLSREGGFSLPETLVGAAVSVVMIGAIVPILWIAAGSMGGQGDRVSALDADRVAFDAIARALRQASQVSAVPAAPSGPTAAQRIAFTTSTGATVEIDCAVPDGEGRFNCVRRSGGDSRELIEGITNSDPFTVADDGRFVALNLVKSPPGAANPVSLQGGVTLRALGES